MSKAARFVVGGAAVFVILAAGYWTWRTYLRSDEAAIRERLYALAADVNQGATEGLGLVTHAAAIGSFFTEDAVVELGQGSEPIRGRDTIIAMAARLQPRTAAFTLAFDDVTVVLAGSGAAEVNLTATFTRRQGDTGGESIDAQELKLGMRKVSGRWLIWRVTSVEPLNKR